MLRDRLEGTAIEERQRAARALLRHALLVAGGPHDAEYALVRRHASWLREWCARHAGWILQIDSELARLRKTPADLADGTRPAREKKSGLPFTRRRYYLLCLALAALERSDRQTVLGKIAEDILALTRTAPALESARLSFDLDTRDQRRDLVQVIRLLLELRVLVRVDGDEQQFIEGQGDVLYSIRRPVLAAMLNVRRGPSTVEEEELSARIAAIIEEPAPDTADGSNRQIRTRLTRRLLDDPVLYYDECSEEELAYLTSQRGHMLRQIREATGLIPEVRREGIALVDDRGETSDLAMPEEGTDGHVTLLLAEYLADRARDQPGSAVGVAELRQYTAGLVSEHRGYWRKDAASAGAEATLVAQAVERLEALRLLRRVPDGVIPLAAIARYALDEVSVAGEKPAKREHKAPRLPGFEDGFEEES